MTKKEVVQSIFDNIAKELVVFDFKADVKKQWFVKRTTTAVFVYDIHFYDRTNIETGAKGFLVEPYIWINIKEIESIYKEITVNTELKRETDFITLGESIAELIPAGYMKDGMKVWVYMFLMKPIYPMYPGSC